MIDIGKLRSICYKFTDTDGEHSTNNPTQELYAKYEAVDKDDINAMALVIKETVQHMLLPEDQHYIDELTLTQAAVLVMDYFKFHGAMLGVRFPGSVGTDEQ